MRKSCLLTFSAKKGPRESQHPAAKKVLSVDSSKPGLARSSLVVNVFFSRDAGTTIKPSMTDLDLRTVSVLEILRLAQARRINPRPRKYPQKYPRRVRSKSPVISRTCEKYPQYPQYPRPRRDILRGAYTHKETLNFTLLIYIYV